MGIAAQDEAQQPAGPVLSEAAAAALKEPGERSLLLTLEESIISGLQDDAIDRIELTTPIPVNLKSLVEDVAAYYGLKPEVKENEESSETVTMTLLRTPESKIAEVSLAKMCEEKEAEATAATDEAAA